MRFPPPQPHWILGSLLLVAAGCATAHSTAETQIRARLASIRSAILAREPEGIVRWGTADWTFTGPDGKAFDRTAYLVRTRDLFARVVSIDALDTHVDLVDVQGDAATVEITQTMRRHERDAATGRVAHLQLRYRERQAWLRAADGWRVRSVSFLGPPERLELPEPSR